MAIEISKRIRRLWIGRDLYDRAVSAIAFDPDVEGRVRAEEFIRDLHMEHPNTNRTCTISNCCEGTQK